MHILVMPSWYATKDMPQSGSFFREQAQVLARAGHRVSLLFAYADAVDKTYLEKRNDQGVATFYVHYKPCRLRVNRLLHFWLLARVFAKFFAKDKPDMIHVHSFSAGRYARYFSRRYHIPYVITEHSSAFIRNDLSRYNRHLARRAFAGASRVIAVSEGLKGRLAPYYGKEITVVPNMVCGAFLDAPMEEPAGGNFRYISVGYLQQRKGMDLLLRAFAVIRREDPQALLHICGGGEEENTLKQLAQNLNISDAVTFHGTVSREQVLASLRQSHAFVLASRLETFGVVAVEALATGRPVIMTRTEAAEGILNDKNGLLVPVEDVKALTDAMRQMKDNYQDYDCKWIRQDCRRRFSEEAVCEQLGEIYQSVVMEYFGNAQRN